MADVTRILSQIESGDPSAAEQLLPLVYDELRKLATAKLAQENPGQTLQATALVHEAYIRLVDVEKAQHWNGRGHFFAAAAEAMRRILVDRARSVSGRSGGSGAQRVELTMWRSVAGRRIEELLALDEALDRLAEIDRSGGQARQTAVFVGLNIREAARSWESPTDGPRHVGLRPHVAPLRSIAARDIPRGDEVFFPFAESRTALAL